MTDQTTQADPNQFLMGGGIPSADFKTIGSQASGTIARDPERQQQTDFRTREPLIWKDGSPRWQVKVVLATKDRDPDNEEDSGERAIYIKGNMRAAVADAVRRAGATGLAVGGKLVVKYTGDGTPSAAGLNPPKQYIAKYEPPTGQPMALPTEPAQESGNGAPQAATEEDPEELSF